MRRKEIGGRLLRRPQQDYPAATVVGFCTGAYTHATHYNVRAFLTTITDDRRIVPLVVV